MESQFESRFRYDLLHYILIWIVHYTNFVLINSHYSNPIYSLQLFCIDKELANENKRRKRRKSKREMKFAQFIAKFCLKLFHQSVVDPLETHICIQSHLKSLAKIDSDYIKSLENLLFVIDQLAIKNAAVNVDSCRWWRS